MYIRINSLYLKVSGKSILYISDECGFLFCFSVTNGYSQVMLMVKRIFLLMCSLVT